ncbi:hypothetical protein ScPMuIL_009226 [Solemya velum]
MISEFYFRCAVARILPALPSCQTIVSWLILFRAVFCISGFLDKQRSHDHSCSNNCTQEKRGFDDDRIFPCAIGGKEAVENFSKNVMNLENRTSSGNAVSLMIGVDWFLYPHNVTGEERFNPALSIQFQLPYRSNDVRAILMTFTSPDDPAVADPYYSKNIRVRLFDFRGYMPPSRDLEHPHMDNKRFIARSLLNMDNKRFIARSL